MEASLQVRVSKESHAHGEFSCEDLRSREAPLLSGRVGIERHPRERFALKITESMQTSNTLPAATRCFCDILSQWLIYDVVPLVFAPAGFLAILRPPRCRLRRKRAVQGHYRLTAQPLSPEGVKRLPA